MKKFKFELESLLSLRKYEQEQAQIELGKAVSAETKIQADLDTLAEQYATVKKLGEGERDFAKIAEAQQFYSFVKYQQEQLFAQMAQAKLVTEEKRAAFNAAMQKTESLKKLRERKFEEHKAAQKKEEAKFLDDISTYKYN
ncbi:MAG: flagellar export protein FliJ [Treponema sp.]|nr:flagellar export protein FliJ [Treponema sp.]MBD5441692.1 flagellar export protein FliJ [Treponema sp.]MDE5581670.1 flagellar export protein FliJ [Treponemataceae bacterium]MDE5776761.1 flagellar export protein FliJ [Treponemataceae bacterium]